MTPVGTELYPGKQPDPFWDELFERFKALTVGSQEKLVDDLTEMIDEAYQTDPKPHWLEADEKSHCKKILFPLYLESMQQNKTMLFDSWKNKFSTAIRKNEKVAWNGRIWAPGELQGIWKAVQDNDTEKLEAFKNKYQ